MVRFLIERPIAVGMVFLALALLGLVTTTSLLMVRLMWNCVSATAHLLTSEMVDLVSTSWLITWSIDTAGTKT